MLKEHLLERSNMRILVVAMIVSATFAPVVLADAKWVEDGWLKNLGQEQLPLGDEFGCYGMPHLDWKADPGAVSKECREYIEERIGASQWNESPISTYTPKGLTYSQHTTIAEQGFVVHGDETGMADSAWHSSSDVPSNNSDWYDLGRRGGSLEKEISDIDALSSELDEGGLVNMYWIGRIYDATVRHDGDVLEMISQRDDVWFTTWGEAYSYWTVENCNDLNHEFVNGSLLFVNSNSERCSNLAPDAWNIPVTWAIELSNESEVVSASIPQISSDEGNTMEGWRIESKDNSKILYISALRDNMVNISFNDSIDYEVMGPTQFFNNKSAALTIAGHSTSDLFLWSKRFDDRSNLVFTWLLTPKSVDDDSAWLPYVGLLVLITTISGIFLVLRREAKQALTAEDLMPTSASGEDDG